MQTLYDLGARKMLLVSVYPVGCNPVLLQFLNKTTCVDELNSAVMGFREQLLRVVKRKAELGMPLAKFSVLNSAKILLDVINNPQPTGIITYFIQISELVFTKNGQNEIKVSLGCLV